MTTRHRSISDSCRGVGAVCLLLLGVVGCGSGDSSFSRATSTAAREVTLPPDLSGLDESVQMQVKQRYVEMLDATERAGATAAERAQAYGRMGMVLHAGEFYEAAVPAYLNAQDLAPQELRWPYYLARLRLSLGDTEGAIVAYRRALESHPNDVPTLVGLGRLHLDRGEADEAAPLFERAYQVAPRTLAVLAGLGQTALARRNFADAAARLEEALTIDPKAASIHSPLAIAYRELGQIAKAEAHLAEWRNTEILVPDPLGQELDQALDSGLSYELRGVRALEQRNFPAAVTLFQEGVELTSGTTGLGRSLRHKLATALYMTGDLPGAVKWFGEALRQAPEGVQDEAVAKAHYSVGVLMATAGRGDEAIRHLSAAVRFSPTYLEAFQALGDSLRRAGRDADALAPYAEAVRINPQATDARFGYGMALVRLGRHREARDWFAEAMRLQPDKLQFSLALARLLAASPDDSVRNGQRAMALGEGFTGTRTTDLGETIAMALAEVGNFSEAVSVQRAVMDASRRAGFESDLPRMAANLQRYERGQPSRVPWAPDDPVFSPGPDVDPALRSLLPASVP